MTSFSFITSAQDTSGRTNFCGRPELFFDVRFLEFLNMLPTKIDLMCLQELRNLDNSQYPVERVIQEIEQKFHLKSFWCFYEPTKPLSFAAVVFYNPDRFFMRAGVKRKINRKFYPLVFLEDKETNEKFWVMSIQYQLPLSEDEKFENNRQLIELKKGKEKILVAGDFNFFDDMKGKEQRKMLLEEFKEDLAYPLDNASGTFFGYEVDPFHKPLNEMSRLDHIFSVGLKRVGKATALGWKEDRNYPSDHVCIQIEIKDYN